MIALECRSHWATRERVRCVLVTESLAPAKEQIHIIPGVRPTCAPCDLELEPGPPQAPRRPRAAAPALLVLPSLGSTDGSWDAFGRAMVLQRATESTL